MRRLVDHGILTDREMVQMTVAQRAILTEWGDRHIEAGRTITSRYESEQSVTIYEVWDDPEARNAAAVALRHLSGGDARRPAAGPLPLVRLAAGHSVGEADS